MSSRAVETEELCVIVRTAVNALPDVLRESVMMFYSQQQSVREISEILEIAVMIPPVEERVL